MNKAEFIKSVAQRSGLTRKDAASAVRAMLEAIPEELKSGGNVQLIGFGTFAVKSRAARTGRNPQTGATIKIKASKTVGFKAGTALKADAAKSKAKK